MLPAASWEPSVSLSHRMQVMVDHARQYEAIAGVERFRSLRKHLGWYCKGFPHAAAMRAKMFGVSTVQDVERIVAEFCQVPLPEAAALSESATPAMYTSSPCAS